MDLTQELITTVARDVNGSTVTSFNGVEIDLSKWAKLSMLDAIVKWWPEEFGVAPTLAELSDRAKFISRLREAQQMSLHKYPPQADPYGPYSDDETLNERAFYIHRLGAILAGIVALQLERDVAVGSAIAQLFEAVAEEHLIQPTIIYDFPLAVSPLSKVKPDEPDWVERFEFYIGGFEVGNAFSELNDPADQLARFEAQVADKDPESMAAVDEDYVRALGYGLPPTAGEGIGIDRLTMILTGSRSIRDVILFPLMRPPKPTSDEAS
jgi:lysyl-tRNA synthetase class 2